MASFTSSGWASGATVNAYAQDAFGNQTGSSVASGTASSAGQVTLSGLADATKYVASDGTRKVRFQTPSLSAGSSTALPGPSGGDDLAALQAVLDGGGHVAARPLATYLLSGPLRVPSNTLLDMAGATLKLTGAGSNVLTNKAAVAQRTFADGAITNGQNVLSTASAVAADVGRTVTVPGAGAGGNGPLTANVTAANPGVSVTLSANAQATVAGASCKVFNRDTNVRVVGLNVDRGAIAGAGTDMHSVLLRHVDGLTVDVHSAKSTAGKYAVSIADATDYWVRVRGLATQSDGLHLMGPLTGGHVEEVSGTTGDDLFAITANDWAAYNDTSGDIRGLTVGTLFAASGGAAACKVIAGAGCTVDGVKVNGVFGNVALNGVYIGDDTGQANTTGGTYGSLKFDHIDVTPGAAANPVALFSPNAERIELAVVARNSARVPVVLSGSSGATINLLKVSGDFPGATTHAVQLNATGVTINKLTVADTNYSVTGAFALVYVHGSTVEDLTLAENRCQWSANAGQGVFCDSGSVGRLRVIGGQYRLFDTFYQGYAGQATGTLELVGPHLRQSNKIAYAPFTLNVILGPLTIDTMGQQALYAATGGALNIFGHAPVVLAGTFTLFTRQGAQAVRVNGPTLSCDVSTLTPTDGDLAFNTNAALLNGTGPCVYNATAAKWKGLYSGATN